MSAIYTIINNDLVPADDASLKVSDLALQRGFGIFDFFKTLGGKPIFFEDHLDRFFYSAEQMKFPDMLDRETLKSLLHKLMQQNNIPDSGIRITLTGGYSSDGYNIATPNLIITQQPLSFSRALPEKGLKLVSYEHQRQLPHVKSIDYLVAVWLQSFIREQGADDVLYHWNGVVTECPRSNFFIVTAQNKVLTPERNILKGITRKHILQLQLNGISIETATITRDDISLAKEAFITSTTKAIMPVASLDTISFGNGTAGPVTTMLREALFQQMDAS